MEIIVAKNSGFCPGVKKAVDTAFSYAGKNACVYGELIHNDKVIEELKSKDFYNRYVKKICDPTTLEFLGNTKNFTEVYEELKSAFSDNLSTQSSFVSLTAENILQQRYKTALDAISANEDL